LLYEESIVLYIGIRDLEEIERGKEMFQKMTVQELRNITSLLVLDADSRKRIWESEELGVDVVVYFENEKIKFVDRVLLPSEQFID
jgi:hypothetical protein